MNLLDIIFAARAALHSHPAIAAALFWILLRQLGRHLPPPCWSGTQGRICGIGVLALYAGLCAYYLAQPHFADHVEASVAAISSAAAQGQQIYPDSRSSLQYGLPYGPLLFQLTGAVLVITGQAPNTSKAVGITAALASLVLLWCALPPPNRTAITGSVAAFLLAFGPMSFWARAEPLLLLSVAGGCLMVNVRSRSAALLLAVCLAVAVNVKASGVVYFVPLLCVLATNDGWLRALSVAALAAILAIAPFTLTSASLPDYLQVLRTTAKHPLRLQGLVQHLEWVLVLFVPSATVVVLRLYSGAEQRLAGRAGLLAGLLLTIPIALKAGAGPYHYLPFIPTVAWLEGPTLSSAAQPRIQRIIWSLALTVAVLASLQQVFWLRAMRGLPAREIQQEMARILTEQSGSVSVGYTENYRAAWVRALPVFAGHRYVLDAPTLMDRQVAGLEFPLAATASLDRCDIRTWVLPRGSAPFGLPNAYESSRTVFSSEFRRVFESRYRQVRVGEFFETWECVR